MNVLVDTSIWSVALRRRTSDLAPWQQAATRELASLIADGRAALMAPVRQELLSGISDQGRFAVLAERLRGFPDLPLGVDDWEAAARISNACRRRGVTGSLVDFALCAAAMERGLELFTADDDFGRYASVVPIALFGGRVWGPGLE